MKTLLLGSLASFIEEVQRTKATDVRIVAYAHDSPSSDDSVVFRNFQVILSAYPQDYLIKYVIKMGSALTFEEDGLKTLHAKTMEKKTEMIETLKKQNIVGREGEWI